MIRIIRLVNMLAIIKLKIIIAKVLIIRLSNIVGITRWVDYKCLSGSLIKDYFIYILRLNLSLENLESCTCVTPIVGVMNNAINHENIVYLRDIHDIYQKFNF